MGTDKDVYAFPDKPTYYKDEECLTSENRSKNPGNNGLSVRRSS